MVTHEGFKQGDIVLVNCDPSVGHEQKGYRPALVVSNRLLNQSGMYQVCPITSQEKDWFPTRIPLDDRTDTFGFIMLDQLITMDLESRNAQKKEECPADILQDVVLTLHEMTTVLD